MEILSTWKNYIERLLNIRFENDRETESLQIHTAESMIIAPMISEVKCAIERLKNYKAPDIDLIPAELIKCGASKLIEKIHKLINLIWNKEVLSEQ